jgi:hypothetical protein
MSRQRVSGSPKKGVTLGTESVIAELYDTSIRTWPADRAWSTHRSARSASSTSDRAARPAASDWSAGATPIAQSASNRTEEGKLTGASRKKTFQTVSGV